MASQSLAFGLWGPRCPDPRLGILVRRARMLRAMWHSSREAAMQVDAIMKARAEEGEPSVLCPCDIPSMFHESMVARGPTQQPWRGEPTASGPAAVCLSAVAGSWPL